MHWMHRIENHHRILKSLENHVTPRGTEASKHCTGIRFLVKIFESKRQKLTIVKN